MSHKNKALHDQFKFFHNLHSRSVQRFNIKLWSVSCSSPEEKTTRFLNPPPRQSEHTLEKHTTSSRQEPITWYTPVKESRDFHLVDPPHFRDLGAWSITFMYSSYQTNYDYRKWKEHSQELANTIKFSLNDIEKAIKDCTLSIDNSYSLRGG